MKQVLTVNAQGKRKVENVKEHEKRYKGLDNAKDLPGVLFFVSEKKNDKK